MIAVWREAVGGRIPGDAQTGVGERDIQVLRRVGRCAVAQGVEGAARIAFDAHAEGAYGITINAVLRHSLIRPFRFFNAVRHKHHGSHTRVPKLAIDAVTVRVRDGVPGDSYPAAGERGGGQVHWDAGRVRMLGVVNLKLVGRDRASHIVAGVGGAENELTLAFAHGGGEQDAAGPVHAGAGERRHDVRANGRSEGEAGSGAGFGRLAQGEIEAEAHILRHGGVGLADRFYRNWTVKSERACGRRDIEAQGGASGAAAEAVAGQVGAGDAYYGSAGARADIRDVVSGRVGGAAGLGERHGDGRVQAVRLDGHQRRGGQRLVRLQHNGERPRSGGHGLVITDCENRRRAVESVGDLVGKGAGVSSRVVADHGDVQISIRRRCESVGLDVQQRALAACGRGAGKRRVVPEDPVFDRPLAGWRESPLQDQSAEGVVNRGFLEHDGSGRPAVQLHVHRRGGARANHILGGRDESVRPFHERHIGKAERAADRGRHAALRRAVAGQANRHTRLGGAGNRDCRRGDNRVVQRGGDDRSGRRLGIKRDIHLAGGLVARVVARQQPHPVGSGIERAHVPLEVQTASRRAGQQRVIGKETDEIHSESGRGAAGDGERPCDDLAVREAESVDDRPGGDERDIHRDGRASLAGDAAELRIHRLQARAGGEQMAAWEGIGAESVRLSGRENFLPEHAGEERVFTQAEGGGIRRGEHDGEIAHARAGDAARRGETRGQHRLARERRACVHRARDHGGDVASRTAAPPVPLHVENGRRGLLRALNAVVFDHGTRDREQGIARGADTAIIESEKAACHAYIRIAAGGDALALVLHAEQRAELRRASHDLHAFAMTQPEMGETCAGVGVAEHHAIPVTLGRCGGAGHEIDGTKRRAFGHERAFDGQAGAGSEFQSRSGKHSESGSRPDDHGLQNLDHLIGARAANGEIGGDLPGERVGPRLCGDGGIELIQPVVTHDSDVVGLAPVQPGKIMCLHIRGELRHRSQPCDIGERRFLHINTPALEADEGGCVVGVPVESRALRCRTGEDKIDRWWHRAFHQNRQRGDGRVGIARHIHGGDGRVILRVRLQTGKCVRARRGS